MSFDAGAITGGIHFDISEFAHGMLEAEAISSVFPPVVAEFLDHPLIGFADLAKETARTIQETIEEVAGQFHQMGLEAMKTGIDPQKFSTFAAAAKVTGVGVEQLGNAFLYMGQRAADALRGDEIGIKAFNDLGIKTRELKGLMADPEEMFYRVADALASMSNQGLRAQAANELMNRSGRELLPFLQQGRAGIQNLANQMGALGAGVNDAEAEMGEKWGLMEATIDAAMMGIKKSVAEPVLDALADHMHDILPVVKMVTDEVRDGLGKETSKVVGYILAHTGDLKGFASSFGSELLGSMESLAPIVAQFAKDMGALATDVLPKIAPLLHGIASAAESTAHFFGPLMDELSTPALDSGRLPGYGENRAQFGPGTLAAMQDGRLQFGQGGTVTLNPQTTVTINIAGRQNVAAKAGAAVQKAVNQAMRTHRINQISSVLDARPRGSSGNDDSITGMIDSIFSPSDYYASGYNYFQGRPR